LKRLTEERDRLAGAVPGEAMELFARVAKLRGAAVGAAVDGMCTLCHVKLRPQMWVDLKKNEELIQCPACSRVLFYEPPVPEVHPQP
jgi:predicted  nucleic acid-binding Zn-ribbon protein